MFSGTVLVLVMVEKIRDPEKFSPEPDPGGKKAPDPGSATLLKWNFTVN
jgi:hypothetical protein